MGNGANIPERNVSHDLLQQIIGMDKACIDALEALGQSTNREIGQTSKDVIKQNFIPPLTHLAGSLDRLLNKLSETNYEPDADDHLIENVVGCIEEIRSLSDRLGLDGPQRIMKVATKTKRLLNSSTKNNIPFAKVPLKEAYREIFELQRLSAAYQFKGLHQLIKKSIPEIRRLSQEFSAQQTGQNLITEFDAQAEIKLLLDAKKSSMDARGIDQTNLLNAKNPIIRLDKAAFIGAVSQLLDNAIKYTGRLPVDSKFEEKWIKTKIYNTDSQLLVVEVESWGTPITIKEYRSDELFKYTCRGQIAEQLKIPGSGVGLYDVREFANNCGGRVSFTTDPVRDGEHVTKSTKTTFRLEMPL